MKAISIQIGGLFFDVNCPEEQEGQLIKAAEHLSDRFQSIKNNATSLRFEEILALSALNSIVVLEQKVTTMRSNENNTAKSVQRMNELLDNVLCAEESD